MFGVCIRHSTMLRPKAATEPLLLNLLYAQRLPGEGTELRAKNLQNQSCGFRRCLWLRAWDEHDFGVQRSPLRRAMHCPVTHRSLIEVLLRLRTRIHANLLGQMSCRQGGSPHV